MAVYGRLMEELDSNNQHYSQQISEIDLTDPEDARVLMPAQGADILAHFGEDHFIERYQRYQAHISEWRQQYPKLAAVDLRYDHQVVLEMASGVDTTQPAVDPSENAKNSGNGSATPAQNGVKAASGKPSVEGVPGKAVPGKSAPDKSVRSKPGAKSSGNNASKAKTAAARSKAARDKKRALAKLAAANPGNRKPSSTTRPQAPEGQ